MTTIRGIAYPLQAQNGTLVLAEDTAIIRGWILSVLQTEPFERVMRPGYGTPDFLFTAPDINLVAQYARQALEREIPDVVFDVLGSLDDGGAGVLTINWAVNAIPQPALQLQIA